MSNLSTDIRSLEQSQLISEIDRLKEKIDQKDAKIDRLLTSLEQKVCEIDRLNALIAELVEWINKRKNKIHPMDRLHKVLQRVEEGKP